MTAGGARIDPDTQLQAGCAALGLPIDASRRRLLLAYVVLLEKWNRAFNLTAVRTPSAMIALHILDSLALLPHVTGERCLDVGSGPGLPGLALAIAEPERRWDLLDSNGKKTRFLTQACMELGLTNVQVVQARAEAFKPIAKYDLVTTRAVGRLWPLARATRHLLRPRGSHLAMKGALPQEELQECVANGVELQVVALCIPGLDAERILVRMRCGATGEGNAIDDPCVE